jgi:hypothetical protein
MFKNQLKMFDPSSGRMTLLADLPVAHSVGSISVSRDGKKVFITIGQTADGNRSEIYSYSEKRGLRKIAESHVWHYTAVEVRVQNTVYISGR